MTVPRDWGQGMERDKEMVVRGQTFLFLGGNVLRPQLSDSAAYYVQGPSAGKPKTLKEQFLGI